MWVCTITVVYDEFFWVMELLMLINFTDQEVLRYSRSHFKQQQPDCFESSMLWRQLLWTGHDEGMT